MALEFNFGTIFGFTILIFAAVAFGVGLLIFAIYDRCIKKRSSTKKNDIEYQEEVIKTEPDGASWTNPVIEMEEVPDEAENNNKEAFVPETIELQPNEADFDEEPAEEEEVSENNVALEPEPHYENTHMLHHPLPEEVQQVANSGRQEEEESEGEVEPEVRAVTPPAAEIQREPSLRQESQETSGYASVSYVARTEDRPPRAQVGKLTNRVSAFEDKFRESTLVRVSRRQELEGIKSKVVSSLVNEYETSDSVLMGRQMSDDQALLLARRAGAAAAAMAAAKRNPSFNTGDANGNNNSNRSSHIASGAEEANRHSYVDADTGEPLYAAPDPTKKSSRRSKRDSGRPVFGEDSESIDETEQSPVLPPKAPDL